MADHDRDAGSRGDEEAPRDPSSRPESHAETLGNASEDTEVLPDPSPDPAHAVPPAPQNPPPPPPPPPRPAPPRPPDPGSFSDFVRQKPAQIIGAGLIGLMVGVLIGGLAVALLTSWADSRAGRWDHPRPDHPRFGHSRVHPGYGECRPVPGGTFCGHPHAVPTRFPRPPAPLPAKSLRPSEPFPTQSLRPPDPFPTVTVTATPTRRD